MAFNRHFPVLISRQPIYKHTAFLESQSLMSNPESFSLIRRLSQIGTLLQTLFCGKEIGRDASGNRYFSERGKAPAGIRQRRWVIYKGEPEPTKVPPEWHGWLHHTTDAPLPESARRVWQKPPITNMTGTPEAWMPPSMNGKNRPKATGDYEAWKPD